MWEGVIYWTKNLVAFAFAALCALSFIAGVGNALLSLLLSSDEEESQDKSNKNPNRSKAADKNNDDDPFKILGLDRVGNITMEEATKARRKLALKWHPDRNIGNEEVATKKMQEINDAFLKVEKILEEGGGDDDDNSTESADGKPHNEQDARRRQRQQRQRKKAAAEAAAAYQRTKSKFESDVKKEFHNYERARRNASKGVFNDESPSTPSSSSGKKKARQRAKKKKAQERENNNRSREAAQCRYPSDGNVGNSRNDIPFHQLPLVQRCEIKFQSKEVVKSAVFYGKEYFIYLHMRCIYSFFKSDEISRILFGEYAAAV